MSSSKETFPNHTEAQEYLQQHKIIELLNTLTAKALFHQPENLDEFLKDHLRQLQLSRQTRLDHPNLFDETNVEAVFRLLDPAARGFISIEQYRSGMTSMGLNAFNEEPLGSDKDLISFETFAREARYSLEKMGATYSTGLTAARPSKYTAESS